VYYLLSVVVLFPLICSAAEELPPIESVEIAPNRALLVNGESFFPLMAWLQDAENFSAVKACGMNTTAGYWPSSSGTKDVTEYLELVAQTGLYGVMPFDARLNGHKHLLGYIQGDEPDLPRQVNDAEVIPAANLRINRKTPLWKIFDGVTHTWSVLDPLQGGSFTVRLKKPVTVQSLAVWLTVSGNLPTAKEVAFAGDGRKLLTATLEAKRNQQMFELAEPATFQELKVTVESTEPGDQAWGSIGEIEGFDAAGKNALLSPPRYEPRAWPDAVTEHYQSIKKADPSRPVFMTLTGNFHPHFGKWTDAQRAELYPAYLQAADVVGYDIYPIYGWNKPEWLYLVHEATEQLVRDAGPRPVYAWIETSKGGQYTGSLDRQHDVTPQHIRAEVWMAICRGATAIGYFTHIWKPSYRQFGVPDQNRKALREINNQITQLAPAILGAPSTQAVSITADTDVKLDLMARRSGDDLYVFAVNFDEKAVPAEATISVEGLPAGSSIEVIDEGRAIRSEAGLFRDPFPPLAVHIYRIGSGS
jgi:hypothetical protein